MIKLAHFESGNGFFVEISRNTTTGQVSLNANGRVIQVELLPAWQEYKLLRSFTIAGQWSEKKWTEKQIAS